MNIYTISRLGFFVFKNKAKGHFDLHLMWNITVINQDGCFFHVFSDIQYVAIVYKTLPELLSLDHHRFFCINLNVTCNQNIVKANENSKTKISYNKHCWWSNHILRRTQRSSQNITHILDYILNNLSSIVYLGVTLTLEVYLGSITWIKKNRLKIMFPQTLNLQEWKDRKSDRGIQNQNICQFCYSVPYYTEWCRNVGSSPSINV